MPISDPGSNFRAEPGKLVAVQNRRELMLTRRRTVDLCRLGGCCCLCM